MNNTKIKINLDSLKSRTEWKRHKVKDGHNIFRILPPFGENSNGYPYRKWQLIWGLVDPVSGRSRPYSDSMLAEKRSPIVEFINQLKARAEKMNAELMAKGVSENEISERLKGLQTLIGDLSPRTSYIYNACDKAGEVGLLELKATAHKDMKARMNEYIKDYNQDPTSLNSADDDSGVWFDIIRSNETGKFRDTKYEVKKVQSKLKDPTNGRVRFEDDRSPLPDAVVENYDNLAYDLSSIYQQKTYDELKELLNANMARITELCPDADMAVEPALLSSTVVKVSNNNPTNVSATPTGRKIALKVDDEEDNETLTVSPSKTSSTATSTSDDLDDFMLEADKILNS